MDSRKKIGGEFLSLCLVTFFTLCNTAVFYNFHPYLLGIGFSIEQAGFIIGLYPLVSMFVYAFFSRFLTIEKAYGYMVIGLLITGLSQVSYHFTTAIVPLAFLRTAGGVGLFLTMASAMNILVSIIPPGKTGAAFSLYSASMLLPYAVMPAFSELVRPLVPSTTLLYMFTAVVLLPALMLVYRLRSKAATHTGCSAEARPNSRPATGSQLRSNLLRAPILCILSLNSMYFFLFSSLFYLLGGYGTQLGVSNPGYFFTIQMGIMVLLRLTGGRIFDTYGRESISMTAFLLTGAGYGILFLGFGGMGFFSASVLFGLGMGLCIPPLNAMLYHHADPKFRGYNANMMLLAMHFGSFCGPSIGAVLTSVGGFSLYCLGAGALICCAVAVLNYLRLHRPSQLAGE